MHIFRACVKSWIRSGSTYGIGGVDKGIVDSDDVNVAMLDAEQRMMVSCCENTGYSWP